jgi:hypothetical protein
MSFLMQNQSSTIGASKPIRSRGRVKDHMVEIMCHGTSGNITACTVVLQGGNDKTETCVNANASLALSGTTAQHIAYSSFSYQLDGTNYTAGASTDCWLFDINGTAIAQTVSAGKYGGLVFVVNSSGVVRCLTPSGIATGAQANATYAQAGTSLDNIFIPKEWCKVGEVIVADAGGGTTFNTTAFTSISTFRDEYCPFYTLYSHVLSEAGVSAQREMFSVNDEHADYIRTYISTLTGTGNVTVKYTPRVG